MENIEIINLWKQYDEKLEKSLSLNQKIIAELQQQKFKNALRPAKNYKLVAVFIGIVYALSIAYFLYHINPIASIFIKVSIGIHLLVTLIAIAMYVRQIVMISEIDNSQNVIQMQQKLACLQTSTVNVIGLCFLQLPVFSTWNITFKMINEAPLSFWLIQMPIVALFTLAGIWLFKNVDVKNMHKKWFKIMFYGVEWSSIIKSAKFLKEIETFEKN